MYDKVGWGVRSIMAAAAVMMFHPNILTDVIGWVLLAVMLFLGYAKHKKTGGGAAPAAA